MYNCNILRLGIKTQTEYFEDPYKYIKKSYNKIYIDEYGCTGFDETSQYNDYIPTYQYKGNIIINLDTCYKRINEYFYYHHQTKKFVLNYGFLGENITLTSVNYLDLFPGEKIVSNNTILKIIDYVDPDERLNIMPLQDFWWKNEISEYDHLHELLDYITFPGICGYYAKVVNPGFLTI